MQNGQWYVVFCIHLVKTQAVSVGQDGPYVLSHTHMVTMYQMCYT